MSVAVSLSHETYVYCKTRFVGFHCWPDAPKEVAYLKYKHRHEFHVTVKAKVLNDNRDIEFITLKQMVDSVILDLQKAWAGSVSCEVMANDIGEELYGLGIKGIHSVEVSEDGENGAVVIYE